MIYLVAPNATHPSGGVGVAAQWVRLLNAHGHDAMFITPNGDPSPYWLNFKVPSGSYRDMVDIPGNKRVDIWMDCMVESPRKAMQGYFFAQDVCQLEHIRAERGGSAYLETIKHLQIAKLITLTHHAHWYYLYRHGLHSEVVNNWVDGDLFEYWDAKIPNDVCMIQHRDHFSESLAKKFKDCGFNVRVAQGNQADIAKIMGECLYFASDVGGRWDGFEYSEGLPMPILEAMSCGCVVFCRDSNGVREAILPGLNGFALPNDSEFQNSAVALMGMLRENMNYTGIQEYGSRARRITEMRFNSRVIGQQILKALELQ